MKPLQQHPEGVQQQNDGLAPRARPSSMNTQKQHPEGVQQNAGGSVARIVRKQVAQHHRNGWHNGLRNIH